MGSIHQPPEYMSRALGDAVIALWSRLPPGIQHDLFEKALVAHGAAIRPQLAVFLHQRHPRTAAALIERAILEPDSLGG
jgi:hypothetical protein